MFRWNMALETGIPSIDQGRRKLLEAMTDFFEALDSPALDHATAAARTGAIFTAMKAAFAAEDEYLKTRSEPDALPHIEKHAAYLQSYVDLCKKVILKIKTVKQAQQSCLEVYRLLDTGVYRHINEESVPYKRMRSHPTGEKK